MTTFLTIVGIYFLIGFSYAVKRARDQYKKWVGSPHRAEEEIVFQTPVTVIFWPIFVFIVIVAWLGKKWAGQ